ncbi:E3 ubiquitin-protein ligase APD1-like isoform X3 [Carya illinoinensis]|uniref:E3 ubiquitin-protein ligase APD1-like isoform X3 n=1 Tax=Carya illinoinensis TaxID=32201 RepID=UPI001C7249FE|nr:E3 ubiquitin-protein ligase APD1-like isoform X3 [Carya illinoinensis]
MCLSCSMDLALPRRQGFPLRYHQSLVLEMAEPDQGTSTAPSSSSAIRRESSVNATSSSSSSQVRVAADYRDQHQLQFRHPGLEPQQIGTSYRGNANPLAFDDASTVIGDDAWSCIIVLLTFWFFVSMTLILGVYGPANLSLGPNCSLLLQPNPIFVQYIKVEELNESAVGPMLYGFYKTPPLDSVTTWSETRNVSIQVDSHQVWVYFLNEGSQINISYSVNSPSSSVFLIIAEAGTLQGMKALLNGLRTLHIQIPPYRGTSFMVRWKFEGNGMITQEIFKPSSYYVALGNLNTEKVEVLLNLRVEAYLFNTTESYYKCTFTGGLCGLDILFPNGNAAVLTSPSTEQGKTSNEWHVKLSYGPRWATYIVGIGGMSMLMFSAFHFLNKFQLTHERRRGIQYGEVGSERAPLLSYKDDDLSSWGSSYDSLSHDEDDIEDFLALGAPGGKSLGDGENSNNTRRLCAICFDAPRDCFFLPCGHCVACFACGTRIAEAAGTCPVCHRNMKKVRMIFTV